MAPFDCPQCGHTITVPARHLMNNIRCRHCRQFVDIPAPVASPPATLDVDVPELPNGVTDTGYTDMEGNPEYQCATCGGRLREPFPRRCPECRERLGDWEDAEEGDEETGISVEVPEQDREDTTSPSRPTPDEAARPRPATQASWGSLLWENVDGFLSEYGGMVAVALFALLVMGGYWWVQAGSNPEVASTLSGVQARLMTALRLLGMAVAAGVVAWLFRRFAGHRWAALPVAARRGVVIGITVPCLVLTLVYASGAPRRASARAFAVLRQLDQSTQTANVGATASALSSSYDTTDGSTRNLLAGLAKVLTYPTGQGEVGQWVVAGRFVKYAESLGMPRAEMLKAIDGLASQQSNTSQGGAVSAGCDALKTVARCYSSSKALRQKARETLAAQLNCEADRDKIVAAAQNRYGELLAWEESQRQVQRRYLQRPAVQRTYDYSAAQRNTLRYREGASPSWGAGGPTRPTQDENAGQRQQQQEQYRNTPVRWLCLQCRQEVMRTKAEGFPEAGSCPSGGGHNWQRNY